MEPNRRELRGAGGTDSIEEVRLLLCIRGNFDTEDLQKLLERSFLSYK